MKKKTHSFLFLAALAALLLYLFGGEILPFAIYQTPIFCNGYTWISCIAKDAVTSPIMRPTDGKTIFNPNPQKETCYNYQCRVTDFSPTVAYDRSCIRLRVGSQAVSLSALPYSVSRGQTFWFTAEAYPCYGYDQIGGYYFYVPVNEVLLWTGTAGSTVGAPVLGADGCTFNAGEQDRIVKLFNQSNQEIAKDKSYTVPAGFAYSIVDSEQRHICGYLEEACSSDSDCTGHPLTWNIAGDSECSNGYLNRYGCRQYSEQCIEWDSDQKKVCLRKQSLSRCEVVERKAVQCCPYTDSCGQGTCDPATFTCKQPPQVECNYDWECGQAQYCDRSLKQVLAKKCVANKCQTQTIKSIECCYDMDCAVGYYCSAQYACLQSVAPKSECPYACCVNEKNYYDKPAPPGDVCCPDHTIAESLEKCGTTPNPDPEDDESVCISREGDGLFVLGYTWVEEGGFIGLFPVGKCVPVYNWPLVVLVGGVLAFLLSFGYLFRPKRSYRRAKRRVKRK